MALNFPNSPTNGQVFGAYTWNATRGVWLQTNMSSRVVTTSDTAPANPSNGDMWMYTVDGTCFIYYNDGSSGQWVEQSKTIMTPATYQSPNFLINGDFAVNQRGAASYAHTSTVRYGLDRWAVFRGAYTAGATSSRQASTVSGTSYALRVQRDAGNTSTQYITLTQGIESINSAALTGNTVTFSFWARAGANFSAASSALFAQLDTGTAEASPGQGITGYVNVSQTTFNITTSWARYSFTAAVPSTQKFIAPVLTYTPVGTAGTNDYFEVTGVQLELGAVATPFRRNANSLQGELAACQRYYYRKSADNAGYTTFCVARADATTSAYGPVSFPVPMRVPPTANDASAVSTFTVGGIVANGYGGTFGLIPSRTNTTNGTLYLGVASGLTIGSMYFIDANNSTAAYVGFSAEI